MQPAEDSRRGSLSISALLNENAVDPVKHPSNDRASVSPVLSNSAISPTNQLKIIPSTTTKVKRKRISPAQCNRLMEVFDQTDTPSSEIRENLAEELDMTKREVQVWFQNRRAKVNRTKNNSSQTVRQRQSSLVSHPPQFYQATSNQRAPAYPVMDQHNTQPPLSMSLPPPQQQLQFLSASTYVNVPYPIAPMPMMKQPQQAPYVVHTPQTPPPPTQQKNSYHPYQRKPTAIDLLASAAEYVSDRNEV